MGSVVPSASNQSSPAKPPLGLPDSPPTPASASATAVAGPDLAPVRSDSPTQMTSDEPQLGAELARTTSLKSSVSAISSRSAGASSTGSTMGVGKRIEPMFNLAVHNVMQPTVVTDAATDTKVAKVGPLLCL